MVEQWEMAAFRQRADVANARGLSGAFPNFYVREPSAGDILGGTIFVYWNRDNVLTTAHGDGGVPVVVTGPSIRGLSEWHDVPLSALGVNGAPPPSLDDFRGRFTATQVYAEQHGFIGGFPSFYHADHGAGIVCGTVLIRESAAEKRDVSLTDLGLLGASALDDITGR